LHSLLLLIPSTEKELFLVWSYEFAESGHNCFKQV
jgi:hypothetical protein